MAADCTKLWGSRQWVYCKHEVFVYFNNFINKLKEKVNNMKITLADETTESKVKMAENK